MDPDVENALEPPEQGQMDAGGTTQYLAEHGGQAMHVPQDLPAPEPKPLPVPERVAQDVDQHVFSQAAVVTLPEIYDFVQRTEAEAAQLGGDIRHLNEISEYSRKFTSNRDPVRAENCRRLVQEYIRNDYHAALVVNLMPESVDELIALIPPLSPDHPGSPFQHEDQIEEMLQRLEPHKDMVD